MPGVLLYNRDGSSCFIILNHTPTTPCPAPAGCELCSGQRWRSTELYGCLFCQWQTPASPHHPEEWYVLSPPDTGHSAAASAENMWAGLSSSLRSSPGASLSLGSSLETAFCPRKLQRGWMWRVCRGWWVLFVRCSSQQVILSSMWSRTDGLLSARAFLACSKQLSNSSLRQNDSLPGWRLWVEILDGSFEAAADRLCPDVPCRTGQVSRRWYAPGGALLPVLEKRHTAWMQERPPGFG